MLNFTTILSIKFKSLLRTALTALLRLYSVARLQTHRHLQRHKSEWVFGLIALSYLIGVFFTLFEFDAEVRVRYHPFYDGMTFQNGEHWNGWVTKANFVYGFMEMFSRMLIFVAGWIAWRYVVPIKIFAVCAFVEMADMVDYWLVRNGPWFTIRKFLIFDNWEFEFNYIKIGIILIYCYTEWKKTRFIGSWEL
jgi:hypothetical protein